LKEYIREEKKRGEWIDNRRVSLLEQNEYKEELDTKKD
jgi:hypothetical protein